MNLPSIETTLSEIDSEIGKLQSASAALRALNATARKLPHLVNTAIVGPTTVHKRKMSLAARKAMSLAQQARWAAKKAA